MIGCETMLAGHCLGLAPVNVWMATLVWGAAIPLLDQCLQEVWADE